jgi:hypothetical protein
VAAALAANVAAGLLGVMMTVNPAAHQLGRKLRQAMAVTACKARPPALTEMKVQLWREDHPPNGGSSDVSKGDFPLPEPHFVR